MITTHLVRHRDCFWFWFADTFEILHNDELIASVTDMDILKIILALKEDESVEVIMGVVGINK
jgi:hypothetical protein